MSFEAKLIMAFEPIPKLALVQAKAEVGPAQPQLVIDMLSSSLGFKDLLLELKCLNNVIKNLSLQKTINKQSANGPTKSKFTISEIQNAWQPISPDTFQSESK